MRLLFKVFEKLENKNLILEVADILNKNFSNLDAIDELHILNQRYDYIVGNPPYVETSKYPKNIEENFGNIYANILKNSLLMLKENGKLCFVIPISYVSTIRMKKIRDFVFEPTCGNSEFLLSYFDYVYNKNFLKSDIKLINFSSSKINNINC